MKLVFLGIIKNIAFSDANLLSLTNRRVEICFSFCFIFADLIGTSVSYFEIRTKKNIKRTEVRCKGSQEMEKLNKIHKGSQKVQNPQKFTKVKVSKGHKGSSKKYKKIFQQFTNVHKSSQKFTKINTNSMGFANCCTLS